ncbi:hypothetical protein B0I35DRAFT_407671 [Stachybotrys elegans]|uniref:DUF3604 domain-containing protein n=1 Tax=Stachybotrys elegans TaxID=80388 RepID=A0A8K0SXG4_9HYPO|nr:hypothetical protein B0I35DRAFT_407671 [Stachybotrys elegans]
MKTLSDQQLKSLAGEYFAPEGLYQFTKALPFLGTLECNTSELIAGQWTEVVVDYTVGASGLADGAWIKGTFKFYSDWALFQTSDPRQDNYISAEYVPGPLHPNQRPATVQSLAVRFDQKGHERPFQKAIIIDIVDGYMNPGDRIVVRIGDRRWGARGTRVQTFVEESFKMRWYIDPVGTSRFAPIKPDIEFPIFPGPAAKVKVIAPRVVRPDVSIPIHIHLEDVWGNATANTEGLIAHVSISKHKSAESVWEQELPFPTQGWTVISTEATIGDEADFKIVVDVRRQGETSIILSSTENITTSTSIPVSRPLFADLHVHSDDTVGTNSTTYNFSYAQQIAGLDVVGYTANDFNVTKKRWDTTLGIIRKVNADGKFVVFPGTEWCGNSAAGGDHNVVFLDDPAKTDKAEHAPEFPFDKSGNVARSFEWNEDGPAELVPGAWPLDEVYATYAHSPENHLLIPHVGGRRANLAWHHPRLERLIEIGSAWGHFEWFLRDAIERGWKLGVSANSDEHRGRCGGGVPGTAVFGTKGGLTGVWADELSWKTVGKALRARRTFATTGERLVGLLTTANGEFIQGDEMNVEAGTIVTLAYKLYGTTSGFCSVEAWDATGRILDRNIQQETENAASSPARKKVRVKWGGARLYDRYREAAWQGSILLDGAEIDSIKPIGGVIDNPEDVVRKVSSTQIIFNTRTSGDFDGVDIYFNSRRDAFSSAQPEFSLVVSRDDLSTGQQQLVNIKGGAELVVSVEGLLDVELPSRVEVFVT